jgi:hypothetical protein
MKTVFVILAACLFFAVGASADICFKQHAHTDEYYYGGGMHEAVDQDIEIWLGDKTMAYITENRSIVIDLGNQKLTLRRNDASLRMAQHRHGRNRRLAWPVSPHGNRYGNR